MTSSPTIIKVDSRKPELSAIRRAARLLHKDKLVAFPTETVYGLGAAGLVERAVARIYKAKGRPSWNPVIQHVANANAASKLVDEWTDAANALAEKFWPGPLTLVLRKSNIVPDIATAGLDAVAVRVPSHPVALALLKEADIPVAAPSANRFTQVSPTSAEHVLHSLGSRVDLILDGGECEVGIESTVLDLTGETPSVLRPGMIRRDEIAEVLGVSVSIRDARIGSGSDILSAARSPGQSVRHYAPKAEAWLVSPSEREEVREAVSRIQGKRTRIAALYMSHEFIKFLRLADGSVTIEMPSEPASYAQKLYSALHSADDSGPSVIIIEQPPDTPQWLAIRDRLSRAAAIP